MFIVDDEYMYCIVYVQEENVLASEIYILREIVITRRKHYI